MRMSKSCLPATITAGLSFSVLADLSAYPAPEWALVLHLRGPKAINLEATADGSAHRFAADAATTASWTAGEYWYALRAKKGADVLEIERGTVRVLPDMVAAGDGYDGRSQAQIALAAIDAVLQNRATIDQERYRINNRELYRTPIADLLKLRSFYVEQVRREQCGSRGRFGRQIPVRFTG